MDKLGMTYKAMGWQTLSVKGKIIKILGFARCSASVQLFNSAVVM